MQLTLNKAKFLKEFASKKARLTNNEIREVFDLTIQDWERQAKTAKSIDSVDRCLHIVYVLKSIRKEIYGY